MATKITKDTVSEATRTKILTTLGKGGLRAQDLMSKTKLGPDVLRDAVKALIESGEIEMKGNVIQAVARKKAPAPAPAKAPAGKISRVKPAPEPEEEEEAEEGYTEEEIADLVAEYEKLGKAKVLNPAQKKRFALVEETLTELGVFEDEAEEEEEAPEEVEEDDDTPEQEEEAYTEEEIADLVAEYESLGAKKRSPKQEERFQTVEETLTELGVFEDDGSEEAPDDEEADFFSELDEDEGEHGDDEDEGSDEDVAPKRGAKKVTSDKGFTMSFKPVDQLTKRELEDRIEDGLAHAESLADQGFREVAELIMRSVTKCRKQLNRK
jgi:ribosomal protein L12E/L44/L45/RPP1/RPP2